MRISSVLGLLFLSLSALAAQASENDAGLVYLRKTMSKGDVSFDCVISGGQMKVTRALDNPVKGLDPIKATTTTPIEIGDDAVALIKVIFYDYNEKGTLPAPEYDSYSIAYYSVGLRKESQIQRDIVIRNPDLGPSSRKLNSPAAATMVAFLDKVCGKP